MRKYKINNSYTIYVPNDSDTTNGGEIFTKKLKPLEWVEGARVDNYFYGKGKITEIDDESITVHFYNANSHAAGKKGTKLNAPIIITYQKEDAFKDLRLVRK